MTKTEHIIINNSISTIAELCSGSKHKIIDLLTWYLWDDKEAAELIEFKTDNKKACPLYTDYKESCEALKIRRKELDKK